MEVDIRRVRGAIGHDLKRVLPQVSQTFDPFSSVGNRNQRSTRTLPHYSVPRATWLHRPERRSRGKAVTRSALATAAIGASERLFLSPVEIFVLIRLRIDS